MILNEVLKWVRNIFVGIVGGLLVIGIFYVIAKGLLGIDEFINIMKTNKGEDIYYHYLFCFRLIALGGMFLGIAKFMIKNFSRDISIVTCFRELLKRTIGYQVFDYIIFHFFLTTQNGRVFLKGMNFISIDVSSAKSLIDFFSYPPMLDILFFVIIGILIYKMIIDYTNGHVHVLTMKNIKNLTMKRFMK